MLEASIPEEIKRMPVSCIELIVLYHWWTISWFWPTTPNPEYSTVFCCQGMQSAKLIDIVILSGEKYYIKFEFEKEQGVDIISIVTSN